MKHHDPEAFWSGLQWLRQSLADIRAETQSKRNGLRDRYEEIASDAAFSQQLLEDERGKSACRQTWSSGPV